MILTGNEIKLQRAAKSIVIEPFDERQLGANSYNVRLADELLAYKDAVLDSRLDNRFGRLKIPKEGLVLVPGRLYLGKTVEYTETHDLVPMLEGRSSGGRLGISIHATAGFGDIGFCGNWTLEISCVQPVRIYAGMEIGQIYFLQPYGEILTRYNGKYQGQTDIVSSRMWQDRSLVAPAAKGLTFRDKLRREHPSQVSPYYVGGCSGCPYLYGYEENPCNTQDISCEECWDREIPAQQDEKKGV